MSKIQTDMTRKSEYLYNTNFDITDLNQILSQRICVHFSLSHVILSVRHRDQQSLSGVFGCPPPLSFS